MTKWVILKIVVLVAAGITTYLVVRDDHDSTMVSRPWTRAELSEGGSVLTLWVERPADPSCEVFDHIEFDEGSRIGVAAAIYERTDQEFCQVPCPLGDEPRELVLDEPFAGSVVPAPGAVPSCRRQATLSVP